MARSAAGHAFEAGSWCPMMSLSAKRARSHEWPRLHRSTFQSLQVLRSTQSAPQARTRRRPRQRRLAMPLRLQCPATAWSTSGADAVQVASPRGVAHPHGHVAAANRASRPELEQAQRSGALVRPIPPGNLGSQADGLLAVAVRYRQRLRERTRRATSSSDMSWSGDSLFLELLAQRSQAVKTARSDRAFGDRQEFSYLSYRAALVKQLRDNNPLLHADRVERGRDCPGVKHSLKAVVDSRHCVLDQRNFLRTSTPATVIAGNGNVAGHRVQPGTCVLVVQVVSMLPPTQQGLLDHVLRGLHVAVDQREYVSEQRPTAGIQPGTRDVVTSRCGHGS